MKDSDYVSPDGALHFLVRSPGGDITMGFEGFAWHTRGNVLTSVFVGGPEAAAEQFVRALVAGELTIAVSKVGGITRDIWITDDVAGDLRYCPANETIEFRLWDGTIVSDGRP